MHRVCLSLPCAELGTLQYMLPYGQTAVAGLLDSEGNRQLQYI